MECIYVLMHNLPLALKVVPHSYDHYQLHKFTHLSLYVNSKETLLLIIENHLQIHCNRDIRMYLFNPFFMVPPPLISIVT